MANNKGKEKEKSYLARAIKKVEEKKVKVGEKYWLAVKDRDAFEGFPFLQYDRVAKVQVLSEHMYFYTCVVLPHLASCPSRFGLSHPYIVTIDKFRLAVGLFVLAEEKKDERLYKEGSHPRSVKGESGCLNDEEENEEE